jgi:hypothetical protein
MRPTARFLGRLVTSARSRLARLTDRPEDSLIDLRVVAAVIVLATLGGALVALAFR